MSTTSSRSWSLTSPMPPRRPARRHRRAASTLGATEAFKLIYRDTVTGCSTTTCIKMTTRMRTLSPCFSIKSSSVHSLTCSPPSNSSNPMDTTWASQASHRPTTPTRGTICRQRWKPGPGSTRAPTRATTSTTTSTSTPFYSSSTDRSEFSCKGSATTCSGAASTATPTIATPWRRCRTMGVATGAAAIIIATTSTISIIRSRRGTRATHTRSI